MTWSYVRIAQIIYRTRKNHSFKFKHLQANCDSYRYSFFPATISSWNNLPFGIEKVDSVEGFKYGGLLYRPMKKKVKGEGWLTGLSRYVNDKEIVIK